VTADTEQEEAQRTAVARAADTGIHLIAVPTPFLVGRVNCYLIEDDPLTLIDTGPNSGKSLDELAGGLRALGRSIEELGLIVITHQHMDHLGLVEILQRRSGAEVAALDLLAPLPGALLGQRARRRRVRHPGDAAPRRSAGGRHRARLGGRRLSLVRVARARQPAIARRR
jgi:glyoxylase-like metal-dependent hydrolase (beta-lactamase superfamily II)